MKLPKTLYATVVEQVNGKPFIRAEPVETVVMDDDGPTVVGTYQLVSTRTLVKQAVEVKPARRARRA